MYKKTEFYILTGTGIRKVKGWSDGTYYYHRSKSHEWTATEPLSGTFIASCPTRHEVRDMTIEMHDIIMAEKGTPRYKNMVLLFMKRKGNTEC